jgi:hypothetical protein
LAFVAIEASQQLILIDLKQKKLKQTENKNIMGKNNIRKIVTIACCLFATLAFVQQVAATCSFDVLQGAVCGTSSAAKPSACIATDCPASYSCGSGDEDSSCTTQPYTASCKRTQYELHSTGGLGYCSDINGQPTTPVSGGACTKAAASNVGC